MYEKIPQTDDLVYDLSWFIEQAAYRNYTDDCPRRQGFEKRLREFLEERKLQIVSSEE
jgi:hypothetical protein